MAKRHPILVGYDDLRAEAKQSFLSERTGELLDSIERIGREFLAGCEERELISKVSGKEYFCYSDGSETSRPINRALFDDSGDSWQDLREAMRGGDVASLDPSDVNRGMYTTAMLFCASVDLVRRSQKTPGTFFEYFAAFFFAWLTKVEPKTSMPILSLAEEGADLTTDFVFDLGPRSPKFHMPVKTSTRERAIMLWAHQKLLDGVYGIERFMGIPVLLAETKTDSRSGEVIEICTPEQWMMYQTYIARLRCIYYLDVPQAYIHLNRLFPRLPVRPLGQLFQDWPEYDPPEPESTP